MVSLICRMNEISIHAPTGGATPYYFRFLQQYLISIHAPTGGATKRDSQTIKLPKISIHAPTGGATISFRLANLLCNISIHAPTGGATRLLNTWMSISKYFNPRYHRGSDNCTIQIGEVTFQFQSTLPQGERLVRY